MMAGFPIGFVAGAERRSDVDLQRLKPNVSDHAPLKKAVVSEVSGVRSRKQ